LSQLSLPRNNARRLKALQVLLTRKASGKQKKESKSLSLPIRLKSSCKMGVCVNLR